MVIVTLKIVFLETGVYLMNISVVLIFIFFIIELLQLMSFASFKISMYFKSIWNWIDMLLYSSLIFFYYNQLSMPVEQHRIFGSLILIVIYYRGFSYLKIIKTFTSLVGIIDTVIKKMMVFLIILFYFYTTTGLLYAELDRSLPPVKYFFKSYIWVLFGGISIKDFETNHLSSIAIFFGTILVTIILLNILIAYLSNLFSRLEEQQKIEEYKEKCNIILDSEIIIYFFRNLVYRIKQKFNKNGILHSIQNVRIL
jgi:hypothetical protein